MIVKNIPAISRFVWTKPEGIGTIKVCFIGAGKMARLHIDTLKAIDGVRVVGISSQSGKSGDALAAEYKITKAYTDYHAMIREQQPDAILVAVNHAVAFQVYKDVLAYGIPVLLEKPAGYSSAECEQLVEIAEKHGTMNMVAVNRRYYGTVNQALLSVLHFGPVRGLLVEANEPLQSYRSRLQYDTWVYDKWLIANSIHAIDLLRMVGGEVEKVIASTAQEGIEPYGDDFNALIRFKSGMVGNFTAHFNSPGGFGIKIYGEGVCADVKPLEQGFVQFNAGRRIKLEESEADTKFKPGLFNQNIAFINAVMTNQAPPFPASDLKDHLKSIGLIEEILGMGR